MDDSKKLSPAKREEALELIQQHSAAIGVAQQSPEQIDLIGIEQANFRAMLQAVANLNVQPDYLLLDFVRLKKCPFPFESLVQGDSFSYSIAAASIVAKVTRDRLMRQADLVYPGYAFAQHKGYTTSGHLARLHQLGPCPIHRRSFAPVAQLSFPGLLSRGLWI